MQLKNGGGLELPFHYFSGSDQQTILLEFAKHVARKRVLDSVEAIAQGQSLFIGPFGLNRSRISYQGTNVEWKDFQEFRCPWFTLLLVHGDATLAIANGPDPSQLWGLDDFDKVMAIAYEAQEKKLMPPAR